MIFGIQEIILSFCVLVLVVMFAMNTLPHFFSARPGEMSYVDWIKSELETMFIKITDERAKQIIWGSVISVSLLLFVPLVFLNFYFAVVMLGAGLILGYKLPRYVIRFLKNKRKTKFNLQMVDGLTLLSNALKSGLSIPQALDLVAKEMPNPMSEEFQLVLSEQQVGLTLEEAFINLGTRIQTEDVDMFTTAVVILRETGGNLAETFDTIVHTIRERIKVSSKIAAMVSQGVMQGIIIFCMPFGLAIAFYLIDPNHITPMFTSFIGLILISVMLVLQIIGGLVIWKIVNIDV